MTIYEAVQFLNQFRHDETKWESIATRNGTVLVQSFGRGRTLTGFEAIAVAEKYLAEKKEVDNRVEPENQDVKFTSGVGLSSQNYYLTVGDKSYPLYAHVEGGFQFYAAEAEARQKAQEILDDQYPERHAEMDKIPCAYSQVIATLPHVVKVR